MESILKTGGVTRGWIGVEPQNLSPDLSKSIGLPQNTHGVIISGVLEGGPADRGGIKPGDVITTMNTKSITDVRDLLNQVAAVQPGQTVTLSIIRKSKEQGLKLQVGQRPKLK